MGLVDLFRAKHRHSNAQVRAEAVRAMTAEDSELVKVARTDRDIGVRRIAIEKIAEAKVLAEIATAETERSLRDFAGERAAQLWSSKACGTDEDVANDALSGLLKLGDQRAIVDVAVKAQLPALRKRAFGELRDPKALAELAKNTDAPQDVRLAAIGRIDDGDVLRAIAVDTTTKEVGLAAVEKLDDADRLENVAQKAKNKAIRQRARKVVQEMAEADRQKKTPVVPDDVKRRRAEKAQLVRELEALADTFDFEKHAAKVKAAEGQWKQLGTDDGDERFTKAAERFWKRKGIFEQQARSADELRAVEREAQRERERAAAEREAQAKQAQPAPAPAPDELKPDDPTRLAREADEKARREERDLRKAEDDARRAAEQASREARKKEDAERAVAIAASLTAMIEDMEKMADGGNKDGRGIDRLLQQAARSFEQIGKVGGEQRDGLSDRYTTARGKLVVRASELREKEDWQRFANVPKAEALIAAAKDMAAEEPSPGLGNRLRELQSLWKEVGPMPQRRSKELWEQFKRICDEIYDKVKGYRAVETEKFGEVEKAKEALIAEAERLANADVTHETANALKALQTRWKESGHLPRKQGDELWKRFRAACDGFFERRKPMLDAEQAEYAENLARKQALIARAQTTANGAPGDGGWGKAIGQIKDLQREWKEIGFVPRRDADAVYKAFRAACDSLFAKRDESLDAEANAHRDAIDDLKAEIADILVGGDDVVTGAIALRSKARELDSRELAKSIEQMIRHVITTHPDAVKGTELDPAQLRARREKLLGKLEELTPKNAPAVTADAAPADIAASLKQAMRSNAFGDLRFSGRDPVEVVDELRTQWLESGPMLDDEDRAQQTRFDDIAKRVLDAAGAAAKTDRDGDGDNAQRGERRRRRDDRRSDDRRDAVFRGEERAGTGRRTDDLLGTGAPGEIHDAATAPASVPALRPPASVAVAPVVAAPVVANIVAAPVAAPTPAPTPAPAPAPAAVEAASAVPTAVQHAHEAQTRPAKLPFEPLPPPPIPVVATESTEQRAKSATMVPPMDELDGGWDLGDEDPTAATEEAHAAAAADAAMEHPEIPTPPSSSEMAGDGSPGGDGIDEPGWD